MYSYDSRVGLELGDVAYQNFDIIDERLWYCLACVNLLLKHGNLIFELRILELQRRDPRILRNTLIDVSKIEGSCSGGIIKDVLGIIAEDSTLKALVDDSRLPRYPHWTRHWQAQVSQSA